MRIPLLLVLALSLSAVPHSTTFSPISVRVFGHAYDSGKRTGAVGSRCRTALLHNAYCCSQKTYVAEEVLGSGHLDRRSALFSTAAISFSLLGQARLTNALEADATPENAAEFYAKWPYSQAADILPFIYATAKKGDVDGILAAMDEFGKYYPMYKLGEEKGRILEKEIAALPSGAPKTAVELGSFLGYSALRTARRLADGGRMFCLEYNPYHVDVAKKVLEHAGLGDRVTFVLGVSTETLPKVAPQTGRADLVLLDHAKELYLGDLLLMEKLGIVGKGTTVAADNVVYPGAPGYLEYVQGGTYKTHLVSAKFEYDQKWKQGWTPKEDALSFSLKVS